nr:unnamed protein product [Callosobruchus chinensis]
MNKVFVRTVKRYANLCNLKLLHLTNCDCEKEVFYKVRLQSNQEKISETFKNSIKAAQSIDGRLRQQKDVYSEFDEFSRVSTIAKRWEEEKRDDGVKWTFLEHKGPVFAPPYERLPSDVKFYYDGKEIRLSQDAEEVAGFYARMLDHDYTTKDVFNKNFFKDWRKVMTEKERELITDLKKCNFKKMHAYFLDMSEKNKNKTKRRNKL